ncbi:MAG TPA: hypothetical protein PLC06_07745 [Promineifilum sp.]|nr:hypothetical protein [Promineifilum sp.]
MNRPFTYGGSVAVTREGIMLLEPVAGAPSPNLGVTVTLTAPDASGGRYVEITRPGALAADVTKVRITSFGFVGGEKKSCQRTLPVEILTAMKAGGGTTRLPGGADENWLGALAGTDPTQIVMTLLNASGWGVVRDLWAYTPPAPTEFEPFVVTANPILTGPLTGGDPWSYTPLAWTGEESVEITHVYRMAEAGGANPAATTGEITATAPNISGSLTHVRIEATASGEGVANPETVYASDWAEIEAPGVETPVTVATPPLMASNRLLVDGITDANFAPRDTLTAGGASATVVKYVPDTSELFLGPITGGPIADNATLSSTSGGAATANGASQAWGFTAGEPFYLLPPLFNGTPTDVTFLQYVREDSDDATPEEVEFTGVCPAHYGTKQYQPLWRYSGYGIETFAEVSLDWLNIGIPTLAPLAVTDWKIIVAAEPGGGDRVTEVYVRDNLNISAAMATTSTQAFIEANQFPAGFEPTTLGATITEGGIVYRRCAIIPWVHNGIDYSVFGAGATGNEAARRGNFGLVVQIGGAWSPLGDRKTVPVATGTPSAAGSFQRIVPRSQEWVEDGEGGGTHMQFPRGFWGQGDFFVMAHDVTWPAVTKDFGDNWESDDCLGLFCQQTTTGICVDLPYVHGQFGPLYLEGINDSYEDPWGGTYRKNVDTNQWEQTKQLSQVCGSNAGNTRRNMRYICKVAGSGSGPDTRTLYQIHAPATSPSNFSTIQIQRSTQGGAPGSWSNFGSSMATGTHGMPLEIWATATHLFLNTLTKVRCRTVGTDTWADATGLPGGEKLHLEVHGSTCYVFVKGQGLYTATVGGGAALAFTRLKQFNGLTFSVSPADPQRIVLVAANRTVTPIGTHNGGASWFNIASLPYPGQPEDFEHRLNNNPAWAYFHDTDPDLVLAMRYQHMGKSTDGGRTFVWASRGLDYSEVRWIGFHPTDPLRFFLTMTDKLTVAMDGGIALDDKLDADAKATIEAYLGGDPLSAYTAGGAMILSRGAHSAYISSVGKNVGKKTPVVSNRGYTVTESDRPSTGNGAISVSITPDLPCGEYDLTCITAAANGGTFKLVGPVNVDMGNFTVGTQRTATHPRGGSITITVSDGSVDFKAGANPKQFTIRVEPIKTNTILNPGTKGSGYYGGTNPGVPHRGITGRSVFELATDGSSSIVRTIPYEFMGYMGTDGTVVAASGNSTLMRGNDTGGSFTNWANAGGNFNPMGRQVVIGSRHSNQRAYCGLSNGRVKRFDSGTPQEIFSFDAFCTQHGISGDWPGTATVNGRMVPPCTGLWESAFDPNMLWACFYAVGMPMNLFRTRDALSANPTWYNCTAEGLVGWGPIAADIKGRGLMGPLQAMTGSPVTDEPVVFSQHGTVMIKPPPDHIATYSLPSVIDYIRSLPGGNYYDTARL